MMKFSDIDQGGRRVLRVGLATHEHNGETDLRVILALQWHDDPLVPLGSRVITFPIETVPDLLVELQRIQAEAVAHG